MTMLQASPVLRLQIKRLYWPVLDRLLREQLGATRTHIYDSTTRCARGMLIRGSGGRRAV